MKKLFIALLTALFLVISPQIASAGDYNDRFVFGFTNLDMYSSISYTYELTPDSDAERMKNVFYSAISEMVKYSISFRIPDTNFIGEWICAEFMASDEMIMPNGTKVKMTSCEVERVSKEEAEKFANEINSKNNPI